jgi:ABC-2 type transport system ATP-binding protein
MTVVRTDHLTKDFYAGFWRPRPHRALSDLSLEVPAGGVFGLLGPNGAGKSTTLKLLTNLLRPTSGRAELFGRPAGDLEARRRLGFLPENPTFYDHLTAEELLTYFAGLFGYRGEDRRRRAEAVLDRVGLAADRRRPIRQYSKGMVQRVGLAQALVNDPELVILDEPMSGLDPIGRREVRDLIATLRDEQCTVLFSSHILSDAESLCHRVAILAKGRLLVSDAVEALTSRQNHGWDVVAADVHPLTADRIAKDFAAERVAGDGRMTFRIGLGSRPEPLVAAIAACGGQLVSVTPLKTTLEDVFLTALNDNSSGDPGVREGEGPRPSDGPLTRVAS